MPYKQDDLVDDEDKFREECGVFGVFGCKDAAQLCYLGLYALQHRGQESAGIVSGEGQQFYVVKDMGLVSKVFKPKNIAYLKGDHAIGHVRYSTTGASNSNNIQPLYSSTSHGKIAIAHNGNLTNAFSIYKDLSEKHGALFQTSVDSEVFLHLYSRSKDKTLTTRIKNTLAKLEGAYCFTIMGEHFLIGARDPYGWRPLVLGKLNNGYILASETCALDLIGATYIREIEPGEMVYITKDGIKSFRIPVSAKPAMCVFEHVYFARPDSLLFGESSHLVRKELGKALAREHPIDADIVIAIPDSGNSAALGYAEESGVPYEIGMTRNHYVGRTFIQPSQKIRDFNVKVKLNPIKEILKGKRVIVVDDSLVRGTTSKQRVKAIRDAGATEIHLRISSPPIIAPCHFGIDTPKRKQLIASEKSIKEIMEFVGADSLGYLSKEGMLNSITAHNPDDFCVGCFTGKYPIKVKDKGKMSIESKYKKIKLYAEKK